MAHEHVRVDHHDALVLIQLKRTQLGPYVLEALKSQRAIRMRNAPRVHVAQNTPHPRQPLASTRIDRLRHHHDKGVSGLARAHALQQHS